MNLDKYTNEHTGIEYNKHVGPHYCPAEMYAGLVACWPWDSQTDGQTSDRYITLAAISVMTEHIKYTDAIAELDGPLYSICLEALGYRCTSCDCHVRRMIMIGDSRCTIDNLFIATWLRLER